MERRFEKVGRDIDRQKRCWQEKVEERDWLSELEERARDGSLVDNSDISNNRCGAAGKDWT